MEFPIKAGIWAYKGKILTAIYPKNMEDHDVFNELFFVSKSKNSGKRKRYGAFGKLTLSKKGINLNLDVTKEEDFFYKK